MLQNISNSFKLSIQKLYNGFHKNKKNKKILSSKTVFNIDNNKEKDHVTLKTGEMAVEISFNLIYTQIDFFFFYNITV